MSIKTKGGLKTYWDTNLDTNGSNAITGAKLNTGGTDLIDSTMPRTYQFPLTGNLTLDGYSQEDYFDGGFVIWSDTSNATFALGDALSTGSSFKVYNTSSGYTITFTGSSGVTGYTTLDSGETAWIYKMATGSWLINKYIAIDTGYGMGTKYVTNTGIQVTPAASTWTELTLPAGYGTQDLVNVTDVANNRLKITSSVGSVYAGVNGHISVSASSTAGGHILLLAYGVNGSVTTAASNNAIEHSIGATSTSIYLPMSFSANTALTGGDEISLFIYSNVSEQITINRLNLNLNFKTT